MERRLLLAITFSLLVILTWSGLSAKFYPIDKQKVREITPSSTPDLKKTLLIETKETLEETSEEIIKHDNQELVIILPAAAIKEVRFKDYQNYRFSLQQGLGINALKFKPEKLGTESTFIYEDPEKRIIKRFIFHKSKYTMDLEIIIQNLSNHNLKWDYPLILARIDLSGGQLASSFQQVVVAQKESFLRLNPIRLAILVISGTRRGISSKPSS